MIFVGEVTCFELFLYFIRCRRTLIARHFGENWDSSRCDKMCDNCNPRPGSGKIGLNTISYIQWE